MNSLEKSRRLRPGRGVKVPRDPLAGWESVRVPYVVAAGPDEELVGRVVFERELRAPVKEDRHGA